MERIVQTFKRTDGEKRIPVLRLEIDYELATLHDAIVAQDNEIIKSCKEKLEKLRLELIRLEA